MTLKQLLSQLQIDWKDSIIDSSAGSLPQTRFDLEPRNFLIFAKEDYKEQSIRGGVNALTNAKRAIDSQLDKILLSFGFNPFEKLPRNIIDYIKDNQQAVVDTSPKVQLMQILGIAPINFISKIRRLRNALEHEYKAPTPELVLDGIELAELFLGSTDRIFNNFPFEIVLGNEETMYDEDDRFNICVHITLNDASKIYTIEAIHQGKIIDQADLPPVSPIYPHLLKFILSITISHDIQESLRNLLIRGDCISPSEQISITLL